MKDFLLTLSIDLCVILKVKLFTDYAKGMNDILVLLTILYTFAKFVMIFVEYFNRKKDKQ